MIRPSSLIAPDAPPAEVVHRLVMGVAASRLGRIRHPAAPAAAAAFRATAAGRFAPAERRAIGRVEQRRAEIPFEMVASGREFAIAPGDGTGDAATAARVPSRAELLGQAWEVCRWTSTPPVWGRLLFKLVRELRPGRALELGTGLGLSGAYQGSALELNGGGELTTVDVHEAAAIAAAGFAELGLEQRARRVSGDIDELLGDLLERVGPIDYALLDAEHSYAATTRHFELLVPGLAEGAVVMLDDIGQGEEMRRAWRQVSQHPRVAFAVAARRMGLVGIIGAGGA